MGGGKSGCTRRWCRGQEHSQEWLCHWSATTKTKKKGTPRWRRDPSLRSLRLRSGQAGDAKPRWTWIGRQNAEIEEGFLALRTALGMTTVGFRRAGFRGWQGRAWERSG